MDDVQIERIILNWFIATQGIKLWTGFIRLWIRSSGRFI